MPTLSIPHGCWCSPFNVFPANWDKPGADLAITWRITYRFYDPNILDPLNNKVKPKQVTIKQLNTLKTLVERREYVKELIKQESELLEDGYNPHHKKIITSAAVNNDCRNMNFSQALWFGYNNLSAEPDTKRDIRCILNNCDKAILKLGWSRLPSREVECSHIKFLLDECGKIVKHWTGNNYNTYRKYLSIVCRLIVQYGALKFNPVRDITRAKTEYRKRLTLTSEEFLTVDEYLKDNYPDFWVFFRIFFFSGTRMAELLRIKFPEDVNLTESKYRIFIKKGRIQREVWKTINKNALVLWENLCSKAKTGDYIFSSNLQPGPKQNKAKQITRRWNVHVKAKLGIEADIYSLHHSLVTQISQLAGERAAAAMKEHTSTAMVVNIYDTRQELKKHEELKGLDLKIGG